jgi:hypothetical protein
MTSVLHPFEGGPFALRMGIHPLADDEWIDLDPTQLASQLALKRELLTDCADDVLAVVDQAAVIDACVELDQLVVDWWAGRPDSPPPPEASLHPIVRASLRTQEDWCVLAAAPDSRPDSPPVLVAGCVCFPTRWILPAKLGRTVRAIHEPVAFYDEQLASPTDRFMNRLRIDAPVWRANWNLTDDQALCQAYLPAPGRRLDCSPADVADLVHLRVERQTLRRMPRSGAIAFGIRVHQQPLRTLEAEPEVLGRLHAAIAALPPDTFAYKGLAAFWPELDAWLSAVAQSTVGESTGEDAD